VVANDDLLFPSLDLGLASTRQGGHDPSDQRIELESSFINGKEAVRRAKLTYFSSPRGPLKLPSLVRASVAFGSEIPDVFLVLWFLLADGKSLWRRLLLILEGERMKKRELSMMTIKDKPVSFLRLWVDAGY
jgi:hypothetical protein